MREIVPVLVVGTDADVVVVLLGAKDQLRVVFGLDDSQYRGQRHGDPILGLAVLLGPQTAFGEDEEVLGVGGAAMEGDFG